MEFEQLLNEALKESPFPTLPNKLIETDGLLGQELPLRDSGFEMREWPFLRRLWQEIQ
jgi:hypothetical protein